LRVRIDEARLRQYAAELPIAELRARPSAVEVPRGRSPEECAAFVLILDAVNFGSGYFPHLRKRAGLSGYRTLETSLLEWWESRGPLITDALQRARPEFCARVFGQSLEDPVVAELMGWFARAWNDLARHVKERHGGDLAGPARSATGSSVALVRDLCEMPLYRDISPYERRMVPFLKRAQITVQDLASTVPGPLGTFRDLEELTIFADNLVPHVLRVDGVLRLAPDLVRRIEGGELLASGSPEEVEIRACAVHAVERLVDHLGTRGERCSARELDPWLWNRGQARAYKALPRHRTRTVFY
jgi:hypothetical protein